MKNEIIYKKGDVITADEQYVNPLPPFNNIKL